LDKQILAFQENNIRLTQENNELKLELEKMQAALEVFKRNVRISESHFDLEQKEFLERRSEASTILNAKVNCSVIPS